VPDAGKRIAIRYPPENLAEARKSAFQSRSITSDSALR